MGKSNKVSWQPFVIRSQTLDHDEDPNLFACEYLDPGNPHGARSLPGWAGSAETESIFDSLAESWCRFTTTYPSGAGETTTEGELIRPILKALGWTSDDRAKGTLDEPAGTVRKPDFALFTSQEAMSAVEGGSHTYWRAVAAVCEGKGWKTNLDAGAARLQGGPGPSDLTKRPVHQIMCYLHWSKVEWGILTNGAKWRLYHREYSLPFIEHDPQAVVNEIELRPGGRFPCYEVNLSEHLCRGDSSGFDYFLNVFHARSHVRPEGRLGTSLVEAVFNGSRQWRYEARVKRDGTRDRDRRREKLLDDTAPRLRRDAVEAAKGEARQLQADELVGTGAGSIQHVKKVLSSAYSEGVVDEVLEWLKSHPDG